jgi:hypothetical protein
MWLNCIIATVKFWLGNINIVLSFINKLIYNFGNWVLHFAVTLICTLFSIQNGVVRFHGHLIVQSNFWRAKFGLWTLHLMRLNPPLISVTSLYLILSFCWHNLLSIVSVMFTTFSRVGLVLAGDHVEVVVVFL